MVATQTVLSLVYWTSSIFKDTLWGYSTECMLGSVRGDFQMQMYTSQDLTDLFYHWCLPCSVSEAMTFHCSNNKVNGQYKLWITSLDWFGWVSESFQFLYKSWPWLMLRWYTDPIQLIFVCVENWFKVKGVILLVQYKTKLVHTLLIFLVGFLNDTQMINITLLLPESTGTS